MIVDAGRAYIIFGSSGALMVTVVTGPVLRRILGPAARRLGPGDTSTVTGPAVKPAR